jgi:hypothetical protein
MCDNKDLEIAKYKNGAYTVIHDKIKKKRNLTTSFFFPFNTAKHTIINNTKLDNYSESIKYLIVLSSYLTKQEQRVEDPLY